MTNVGGRYDSDLCVMNAESISDNLYPLAPAWLAIEYFESDIAQLPKLPTKPNNPLPNLPGKLHTSSLDT